MTDQVALVTVGNELLLGFTVDGNAAVLGHALASIGVSIVWHLTVGDDAGAIRDAIEQGLGRTGFVITTGGLGPTRDDITKGVVSEVLGCPLEFDDAVWQAVVERYRLREMIPPESNRSQAMVPRGASVLPNRWGSAPGLWLETDRGVVVLLPGVPLEMRMLLEHEVVPRLGRRSGRGEGGGGGVRVVRSATVRTCGVAESALAERIGGLEDRLAPLSLAYLPGVEGVDLRLTAWHVMHVEADAMLQRGVAALRRALGEAAYGTNDDDLAAVVLARLRSTRQTLAVAESCTGGLLGGRLTAIPGASAVFIGGAICYANAVKTSVLGVPAELIDVHGAVSGEVAEALARGARERYQSDIAVSITGIAGPDGGSAEKPVGTVWFGLADAEGTCAERGFCGGDRNEIRARAVQAALRLVWRRVG